MNVATWRVEIPDWHPARLNQLLRNRWVRRDLRQLDDDMVAAYCRLAEVTRATLRRRVSLEITLTPRQRGADPDCWWKSVLDALVNCGAIRDDSVRWVELGAVVVRKGKRRQTIILIEDVEEET